MDLLIKLLPQPTVIIFISTFAGALAGEFYREVNDTVPCSLLKFLSRFIASLLIGFSIVLIIRSVFKIQENGILIGLSIVFGFEGHKTSLKCFENLLKKILKD